MAWFQSSCLDFAWSLGSFLVLLRSCLRCWSLDHHVAFVQVMFCTLLNYKTNTCKFISPIWLCWSSNTKIQSKWAKGPFSLQSPPFWWLMPTRPKQANNKNLEVKNYLLARMQCKGQGYMILIDRYQLKLYLKAMSCPCKCPHVMLWIKAYLSKRKSPIT